MGAAPLTQPTGTAFCSNCGRQFRTEDLMRFGESWVCADCKGVFTQRLREGAALPNTVVYGGFWRRFAAILLDGLILGACSFAINGILGLIMPMDAALNRPGPGFLLRASALGGISLCVNIGLAIAYQVYFLTKSGATPGKMALGLKVVMADGGPISPGRAVGRYFAQFLSSITLGIGYIIAAFDLQKRALHDHICNTRVIRVA
jgi:uncharacterized RDD family membrane protein YckC